MWGSLVVGKMAYGLDFFLSFLDIFGYDWPSYNASTRGFFVFGSATTRFVTRKSVAAFSGTNSGQKVARLIQPVFLRDFSAELADP